MKKGAKRSSQKALIAVGAVAAVIVIALAAVIWASSGNPAGHKATTTTMRQGGSTVSQQSGEKLSAQDLITILSSYRQQEQFTANYSGSVYTSISTGSGPITGNLTSEFMRYNGSARTITAILSDQVGELMTSVYYPANGLSYACTANSTMNYTCQRVNTNFNASTFGLSSFLGSPSNSSSKTITAFNSSYRGIPCIGLSSRMNSSYNSSGVIVTTRQSISSCVQPEYRIPLLLSINTTSTASGSYLNGSRRTAVPPVSETVMVNLHLVNLTNSSSQSEVEGLPANAVIVG